VNLSAPFIRKAYRDRAIDVAIVLLGRDRLRVVAGSCSAERRFADHSGHCTTPGADPQTMASSVATPLERQFGQIPGLTQMTSSSALGYTQITLQFDAAARWIRC